MELRKLLYRIGIVVIILVSIDFIAGIFLDAVLENSPDGRYYKANYTLNECKDDVIILGSSRAETNFAPFVFEDSLNLSVWNAGRGGQGLPFWYASQQGILANHSPKIAIINVEYDFLSGELQGSYERAGFLRPFYKKAPAIQPIINEISTYEKYLVNSKLYVYNSSFYYLFRPYFFKGLDGPIDGKGWKKIKGVLSSEVNLSVVEHSKALNPDSIKLFEQMIHDFQSKNCSVFVVISPNYGKYVESSETLDYLKKERGFSLLDESRNLNFIENNKLFNDKDHLNTKGAILFSQVIAGKIKSLI